MSAATSLINGLVYPAGSDNYGDSNDLSAASFDHPAFIKVGRSDKSRRTLDIGRSLDETHLALNMSAVTWNMAERSPTLRDCAFLKHFTTDDFIVLGKTAIYSSFTAY